MSAPAPIRSIRTSASNWEPTRATWDPAVPPAPARRDVPVVPGTAEMAAVGVGAAAGPADPSHSRAASFYLSIFRVRGLAHVSHTNVNALGCAAPSTPPIANRSHAYQPDERGDEAARRA